MYHDYGCATRVCIIPIVFYKRGSPEKFVARVVPEQVNSSLSLEVHSIESSKFKRRPYPSTPRVIPFLVELGKLGSSPEFQFFKRQFHRHSRRRGKLSLLHRCCRVKGIFRNCSKEGCRQNKVVSLASNSPSTGYVRTMFEESRDLEDRSITPFVSDTTSVALVSRFTLPRRASRLETEHYQALRAAHLARPLA